ncbi:reverse transcriptase [Penicillium argentinense]|uniref:Reverse transcriptase n=1 Tax=Penicillium argentinense TaxID=1131581 RepID=A0A9W9F7B8_9EURO|nr:reverse transcriptase [Penicillium argentinense]KAJ5094940.1 reverse transcriptase [Penicillium argentinense]
MVTDILQAAQDNVPRTSVNEWSIPGYTQQLAPLRAEVRRARRRAKTEDPEALEEFRQLRHKLGRQSAKIARTAHRERVEEATQDIQGFWNLAKWARNRGTPRATFTPTLQAGDRTYETAVEKAQILQETLFPPAPDAELGDLQGFIYPTSIDMPAITQDEVTRVVLRTASHKAPGPDGIPNAVLKKALEVPHFAAFLTSLFNECLRHGYCPRHFRESTTVVLRKPGKPDYTVPRAYRPIALLNTFGKAMEAVIAARLSFLVEEYQLLPETHIGGRKGRSCDHAIHLLLEQIHASWRNDDRVASLLTLDVSGAFDNASHRRLLHNLRKRRVPQCIIRWVGSFLRDRQTSLLMQEGDMGRFGVATGIPQGSPISPILYLFYNADLIDEIHHAAPGQVLVTGYIDDICILVWSKSSRKNCRLLQHLHQIAETWEKRHASRFAPAKYGLMHMYRTRGSVPPEDLDADLELRGETIRPTKTLRYLGVYLDEHLTGLTQIRKCHGKESELVSALRSIAGMTWGVNLLDLRRMYTAVLWPQISFACSSWFTWGPWGFTGPLNELRRTLESIQHQALYRIAGAFRTTARAALEVCLYIPPPMISLTRLAEEACIRLCSSPFMGTLRHIRESGKRPEIYRGRAPQSRRRRRRRRHSDNLIGRTPYARRRYDDPLQDPLTSPLERLEIRLRQKGVECSRLEPIQPFAVAPWWKGPETVISSTKDAATHAHHDVLRHGPNGYIAYTDGSAPDKGVGVAAIYPGGKTVARVGTRDTHTVYAAELQGIQAALAFLVLREFHRAQSGIPNIPPALRTATIFTDNQAAIRACAEPRRGSGQGILRSIVKYVDNLNRKGWKIRLQWIPGHNGVYGNERADVLARDVANAPTADDQGAPIILTSSSRTKLRSIAKQQWEREWATGRSGAATKSLFPAPTKAIFRIHEKLRRAASFVVIQMQTAKIALASYLGTFAGAQEAAFRDPTLCPCDRGRQTVRHVLFSCTRHVNARARILDTVRTTALQWQRWLTEPELVARAANFMLQTRLLGQFGSIVDTYRVYHNVADS